MSNRTAYLLSFLMLAGVTAYSLWVYTQLPDRVPTHWDINGRVDGWGPKWVATLLTPGIMLGMIGLFAVLPAISPRKFEIDSFRDSYNVIVVGVMGLFAFIQLTLLSATRNPDSTHSSRILIAGMMFFFALLGNRMGKVRRNFWMGIRTPWTLASDVVWDRTHRLAGRLMVAGGLLAGTLGLLGANLIVVLIIGMSSMLYPVLYSYFVYRQVEA